MDKEIFFHLRKLSHKFYSKTLLSG